MSLRTQLQEDMKQALRARESLKLNTIRFLLSEIKNADIDQGELDDAGIQKVITKLVKTMKDALEEFKKGGRTETVAEEEEKIAVLEAYLPEKMTEEELMNLAKSVQETTGLTEMGPLIGAIKKKAGLGADGSQIAGIVKQLLS